MTSPRRSLLHRPRAWLDRAAEWVPLAAPAAAAGAGALFLLIADEVAEGDTADLDTRLLLAFRTPGRPDDPIGPPWVEDVVRDVTALGGNGVLALLMTAVVGLLLLWGRRRDAGLLLVSVLGSVALSQLLKALFARPRPDLVPHGQAVTSPSFPSGHSMVATAVYLTLAAMLARALPSRRTKLYVLAWALAIAFLVGLSRVILGVHWPSDVLGGWSAGAAWALGTWGVADAWSRWRSRRTGSPT